MSTAPTQKRITYVYALNIISCFAVVLLHTTLGVFSPSNNPLWRTDAILQACGIFAVPIFFMVSGMNLLAYRTRYDTPTFFRKRALRIGKALIYGSVVCYLLFSFFPQYFYASDQISFSLKNFLQLFLTNGINSIYWFLYSIIYLYMLIPLLSLASDKKKTLEYIIGTTLFISVILPFINKYFIDQNWTHTFFNWPFFSSISLLYLLLGYYINTFWKVVKFQTIISGITFIISTVAMAVLNLHSNGYFRGEAVSQYDNYWAGISSPTCVIQVVSLFLFFQSIDTHLSALSSRTIQLLNTFSSAALGVYLYHILLINFTSWSSFTPIHDRIAAHPLLHACFVYLITVCIVIIGKKLLNKGKSLFKQK